MDLGTIYTLPTDAGFLELVPNAGLSLSSNQTTYRGPWQDAVLRVSGPGGGVVVLMLSIDEAPSHGTPRARFIELITVVGSSVVRLDGKGGVVRVPLVGRNDFHGRTSKRLRIGGLIAIRHGPGKQVIEYGLKATCVDLTWDD
jgi:hypothetical protein